MPIGRPIRLAAPTMMSVPTIACATPPPVSPAGAGVLVKKSTERLPAPLNHQVEQNEEEREQRDHHGQHHQADHRVAHQPPERPAVHSALLPMPDPRATRQMSSRAPAFTSTVTTKSRNATYARAERCMSPTASENSLAIAAAMV